MIVGAGLSGLATAYYIASQNENNKVLLLEKERKVAQGSSSRNTGLFMTNCYEPWTEKPLLQILPGFLKITGPQCGWLTSFAMSPGSSKFIYYFLM